VSKADKFKLSPTLSASVRDALFLEQMVVRMRVLCLSVCFAESAGCLSHGSDLRKLKGRDRFLGCD